MLVSYNLDILYFNKQISVNKNNWFAGYCKSLTEYCSIKFELNAKGNQPIH
jgi:hypothetical protein